MWEKQHTNTVKSAVLHARDEDTSARFVILLVMLRQENEAEFVLDDDVPVPADCSDGTLVDTFIMLCYIYSIARKSLFEAVWSHAKLKMEWLASRICPASRGKSAAQSIA